MEFSLALGLILFLVLILASGFWIGFSLLAVGLVTMLFVSPRPVGDSMVLTIWGSTSSWTLTALPLFLWMGEILFRTRLSENMFAGLAPWFNRLPGRLLHVNVLGSAIFAAVSGSSAATCSTIGKISLPELERRGYPERMAIGSLAGAATLGLLIPPSIIMIVYGVAADVSIARLFVAGALPGAMLAVMFMGYIACWALLNPDKIPPADKGVSFFSKVYASRKLIPIVLLILTVLGSIYTGIATATEAAAIGVLGSLALAFSERSLNRQIFVEGLAAAARLYCMIGLILAGAAFLTLAMGFVGLPRHLAEYIGSLQLSPFSLVIALTLFFLVLGCFLDGISMVVLTISVLLPTVQAAGLDLIWFGVFIVLVVEVAQITPPVGLNLFVLQGLTKRDIGYIAGTVIPMFVLMMGAIVILYLFPQIALWLPSHM
ncbi:TRAP transporter large permease subunit [Burkholderiaceae bacterium]|jgi:C4-dicarboxylate transporter DctM subunit|nr:TRAP transporter large permease subunit [Paracoccaceae bacterium]MCH9817867.1 TRAP transporter large permease subunit [Betaproteobacteria bacterium]MDB4214923.1 TRAP transporter large permease subunit [Burkholderiaceae bacterium]MCH9847127.1 TRAP transporter large permease subunit [Betaproteobacteria bacterium]MDC0113019.1 TRAP transporter large permease subunit [Burkholderiaceae bacterium]|tara:strand:- start:215 stop:1507 length:1293 start_codon:yes stop_codon:yes gene_type:complete